jgi:hypothetical protein
VTELEGDLFQISLIKKAEQFLKEKFPPDALQNPLSDNAFLAKIAASKDILPQLFAFVELNVSKKDYYQIAEVFEPDEVHPDVKNVLNKIAEYLV